MEVTMEETAILEGEAAVTTMKANSAYERLQESRNSIDGIVSRMLEIKKGGEPKLELRELATQMFIHFIALRQENRNILLEEDRIKGETEAAKVPVDLTTLQLHNLMYEKNHYVKAIKTCRDFKSKYPNIDLISEEKFTRDAPEEIKSPTLSSDSGHDLMLKRLNYELFQRKELCKLREKLEQQKKSLLETIANRKKFLSSLPSHLKALKKASLPVQQQFGILHTKRLKQHNLAELLPPPLYILYSQISAYKEAFGENLDLEIVGSPKDAQAFTIKAENRDADHYYPAGEDVTRMEEEVQEEDDEERGRRKRVEKTAPVSEPDRSDQLLKPHPLRVVVHMNDHDTPTDPSPSISTTVRFEYLPRLSTVCVGVDGFKDGPPQSHPLCNLFPDDTGLHLPHESAKLLVGDDSAFDETRTFRPYKWAQHLCGIDFLPEFPPPLLGMSSFRRQNRVQNVLRRIRSRRDSRTVLSRHLDSLSKLEWPVLTYRDVPWAPHDRRCRLHAWSPVAPSPAQPENGREDGELPSLAPAPTEKPLDPAVLRPRDHDREDSSSDTDPDSEPSKPDDDTHEPWPDYGAREFELTLARPTATGDVRMEARVHVSTEYPLRPPLFRLRGPENDVWSHNEVRAMEVEVNVHAVKTLPRGADDDGVLAHQLACLAMLFDVYMDGADDDDGGRSGGGSGNGGRSTSVIDVGLSRPTEGAIPVRTFRGRDRRRILSWKGHKSTASGYPY